MTSIPNNPSPTVSALKSSLALGFKFLAWINGMGVVVILAFGLDIIQVDLAPQWLRLPMAAFLAGMVLSALGLLWTYPALASLLNQLVSGRARRTHWLPLSCTMIAYALSLFAFVCGCWITLGLGHLAYQNAEQTSSMQDGYGESFDQSAEEQELLHDVGQRAVRFVP
ncbi:hypothetical protein CR159_12555 [Pollutimonas subterranea]|uniref:Uncharacterized protein n=1 Tax=Pollutimonas subterranea TaxID=2045210 RepID=A0A2N4U327_9BURK|nr:hypothetical protein [Pollutimonas subterranea]PLC49430.1 hypothetical protein CR159_12555 [Pollutimonas subterranea]